MRARAVLPAATWETAREVDAVSLDHDHRHRRRIVLRTEAGNDLLLDLPQSTHLHEGDGLLLDDGGIVRVRARFEPLMEIRAEPDLLLRLAWHLGNRHLPVQFLSGALRLYRDPVIADMAGRRGAEVRQIDAPFDPEPGAYDHSDHG